MHSRLATVFVLIVFTLAVQVSMALISAELLVANPLLALLVVLSLRHGKVGGILWGAALGLLTDLNLPPLGYHGISMCLVGYFVAWLGGNMVIRGPGAVAFLTLLFYAADLGVVTFLHLLLGQALAPSLWLPVIPAGLFTAAIAMALEALAERLARRERAA